MLRSSKHLFPACFLTKTSMHFLGEFAKLWKGTIASSCLSARPHGTARIPLYAFSWKFAIPLFFEKSFEKVHVCLESNKNNRYFTRRPRYVCLAEFIVEWEMFQAKVVEKIKTHFVSSNSFTEICAVYETGHRWKYNMAHARWITQASDIQNTQYLLLFHGKSGYKNAPRCCVYTYIVFCFPPYVLRWVHTCNVTAYRNARCKRLTR